MRSPNYLVLIRDGRLALAVGAALEERLQGDGHQAMALVPAVRGPDFADSAAGRLLVPRRPSQNPADRGPHVVALDEDGLLASLASLGLPAYVGTHDGDEPRIARWPNAPGAILLPVATARDLIDAIASHTPWSRYAAELPPARQPARSRKAAVTVASVAGPLLLASLPPLGVAVGGVATHAPALAAATAPGAAAATLTADAQSDGVVPPIPIVTPDPVPIPPTTAGTSGTWSNLLNQASGYLTQATAFANATTTGTGTPAPVPIPPTNTGTPGTWSNLLNQAGDNLAQATAKAFATAAVPGANGVETWAQSVKAQITQAEQSADSSGDQAQQKASAPPYTAGGHWTMPSVPVTVPNAPVPTASSSTSSGNTTAGSGWHWPRYNATTSLAHSCPGQWHKMPSTPVSTPASSSSGGTTTSTSTSTSSASSGNTSTGPQAWTPVAASSGVQPGQLPATASTGSGTRIVLPSLQPSHSTPAETLPPPAAVHATPLRSSTPATTLPMIPANSGSQGSLPLGDY